MNNTDEKRVWGIHSTDDRLFLRESIIAVGWSKMGDLRQIGNSREDYKEKFKNAYPDAKKGSIAPCSGMLYRFLYEMQIGDYVVYPSRFDRMINIGVVDGEYYYNDVGHELSNRRKVKWLKKLPRTSFSQGALYEIGAIIALFTVRNYTFEFINALDSNYKATQPDIEIEGEGIQSIYSDVIQSTSDYILKALKRKQKGFPLEHFIADLLRAMGYQADVSKQCGDRGIDIIAYKGELPPRIVVQVKSQDSNIGEEAIHALRGAMSPGDYGLFVTLSDFSKNAQDFLQHNPIIKGINGDELVALVKKYYSDLSEESRNLIPMEKVYIPVTNEPEKTDNQD